MKKIWSKIISGLALITCLVLAYLNFKGQVSEPAFKLWFLVASVVYFVLVTISISRKFSE
ncbi:MAG: hypothetical protein ACPLRA_02305 [Candidatus Saccharicenans sp.]